jgi:hypothetical protein
VQRRLPRRSRRVDNVSVAARRQRGPALAPQRPVTATPLVSCPRPLGGRHLHRRLRLADPSGALAALRGWPLINLLTGGRLLASGPAG